VMHLRDSCWKKCFFVQFYRLLPSGTWGHQR
jgi:hypothetical protein